MILGNTIKKLILEGVKYNRLIRTQKYKRKWIKYQNTQIDTNIAYFDFFNHLLLAENIDTQFIIFNISLYIYNFILVTHPQILILSIHDIRIINNNNI